MRIQDHIDFLGKEYNNEEKALISASNSKRSIIAAVFAPILTFLFMGAIVVSILYIVFPDSKGLGIAQFILVIVFLVVLIMFFCFFYSWYSDRLKVIKKVNETYLERTKKK